jgi:hypothetical protein
MELSLHIQSLAAGVLPATQFPITSWNDFTTACDNGEWQLEQRAANTI